MLSPSGFGMGIVQSAVFMALQVAVEKSQVAPAVSTLYLSSGIGAIVGLASMSAVLQEALRRSLINYLGALGLDPAQQAEVYMAPGERMLICLKYANLPNFLQIISKAVSDVGYIYKAKGTIAEAVVASYVDGLWYTHCKLSISFVARENSFLTAVAINKASR